MRISDWSSDVCSSDLYVGEVKQEKGFLALPQVAEDLASRMPERSRLVIQFVSVRNAAGRQVLNELKGLAIRLPQIELHHGFWSDEHLHEALAASSVFYMNYDAEAYAHKTSGLDRKVGQECVSTFRSQRSPNI